LVFLQEEGRSFHGPYDTRKAYICPYSPCQSVNPRDQCFPRQSQFPPMSIRARSGSIAKSHGKMVKKAAGGFGPATPSLVPTSGLTRINFGTKLGLSEGRKRDSNRP
jgi:hypothetical protein